MKRRLVEPPCRFPLPPGRPSRGVGGGVPIGLDSSMVDSEQNNECLFDHFVMPAQTWKLENIPPKTRRYRCGKEAFGEMLMNGGCILSKHET